MNNYIIRDTDILITLLVSIAKSRKLLRINTIID